MINDCHVHIGKQSMINQVLSFNGYVKFRQNFPYMGKTLIMGTDLEPNNDVLKACHLHDWAYGLYWMTKEGGNYELDDKLIGVKFHGGYLGVPVTSMKPSQLEALENKILLVHCGRYLEGDIKSNTSWVHAATIARTYPKIKVIMAHMGGTDTTVCMKAIAYCAKYQNVYFDTSGITTPFIIEYAVQYLPLHRILFGSDMPWCSFNAMVWTLADAMISQEQKQAIFEDNFNKLLQ